MRAPLRRFLLSQRHHFRQRRGLRLAVSRRPHGLLFGAGGLGQDRGCRVAQRRPYSALAVADRHKLSFDNTCTCHRSFTRSYLADLLRDRTLRNGDLVMTANGFAVFRSDRSGAVSAANFVALSKSSSVPKNFRPELTAMERAGIWDRQSGPYSYSSTDAVASSGAVVTAITTTVPLRLRKGITVDDGDATR